MRESWFNKSIFFLVHEIKLNKVCMYTISLNCCYSVGCEEDTCSVAGVKMQKDFKVSDVSGIKYLQKISLVLSF